MTASDMRPGTFPKVSILIPSYNSERYLAECIESALHQSYRDLEVIVVDDGSTDGGLALARSFEPRGVRVIAQPNRGQPAALNAAFGESSGAYVQYLDADDVLHPQKIERQIARLLDAGDSRAMASGAWSRFRTDLVEATFTPEPVWTDLEPIDWLVSSWQGGGMMHVAGWLIPRSVVQAAGAWPEALRRARNIDGAFFTRALLASTRCLFCRDAKSYYRSVPGSHSSIETRASVEATLAVILQMGTDLLEREDSKRTRAAFADNLQRLVYGIYPRYPDMTAAAEDRVRELGGSNLPFSAGPLTRMAAGWIGWKLAKRCRSALGPLHWLRGRSAAPTSATATHD